MSISVAGAISLTSSDEGREFVVVLNSASSVAAAVSLKSGASINGGGTLFRSDAGGAVFTVEEGASVASSGTVNLGGGNDTLSVAGDLRIMGTANNGGAGTDTLAVTDSGTAVMGALSGFENIALSGGSLAVGGAISGMTNLTVAAGATLDLAAGGFVARQLDIPQGFTGGGKIILDADFSSGTADSLNISNGATGVTTLEIERTGGFSSGTLELVSGAGAAGRFTVDSVFFDLEYQGGKHLLKLTEEGSCIVRTGTTSVYDCIGALRSTQVMSSATSEVGVRMANSAAIWIATTATGDTADAFRIGGGQGAWFQQSGTSHEITGERHGIFMDFDSAAGAARISTSGPVTGRKGAGVRVETAGEVDINVATVTGGEHGITVRPDSGSGTVAIQAGNVVARQTGIGIYRTAGDNRAVDITVRRVEAGTTGINSDLFGSVTVVEGVYVTGSQASDGIKIMSSDTAARSTDIAITVGSGTGESFVGGNVHGGNHGIDVRQSSNGTGGITVRAGAVTGRGNHGIYARQLGSATVTLTLTGTATGNGAGKSGIYVRHGDDAGGTVEITAVDAVGTHHGIHVKNGNLSSQSSSGSNTITVSGDVRGGFSAIKVEGGRSNSSAVVTINGGTVTGGSDSAIDLKAHHGTATVIVGEGAKVTGDVTFGGSAGSLFALRGGELSGDLIMSDAPAGANDMIEVAGGRISGSVTMGRGTLETFRATGGVTEINADLAASGIDKFRIENGATLKMASLGNLESSQTMYLGGTIDFIDRQTSDTPALQIDQIETGSAARFRVDVNFTRGQADQIILQGDTGLTGSGRIHIDVFASGLLTSGFANNRIKIIDADLGSDNVTGSGRGVRLETNVDGVFAVQVGQPCTEIRAGTFECRDSSTNSLFLTVLGAETMDVTLFGAAAVTTTSNSAIDLLQRGSGGVRFTQSTNGSEVTGRESGLFIDNSVGGAVSVVLTGVVTGETRDGIEITNSARRGATTVSAATVTGADDGISVLGAGSIDIAATKSVTGGAGDGIAARTSSGNGDITITAATVAGGDDGISATGAGSIDIAASGSVTGSAGAGIAARITAGGGDITITAASVSGADNGILAQVASRRGSEISIRVSGSVSGGSATNAAAINILGDGAGSASVTLLSGASVGAAGRNAILAGGGAASVTVNAGATIAGKVDLGAGADTLRFDGGSASGTIDLAGGAGADTLVVSGSTTQVAARISGWETVSVGNEAVLSVDGALAGVNALHLENFGTLDMGDGVIRTLTVSDFTSGGVMRLDVRMHPEAQRAADKIVVTGSVTAEGALTLIDVSRAGPVVDDVEVEIFDISATNFDDNNPFAIFSGAPSGFSVRLDNNKAILRYDAPRCEESSPGSGVFTCNIEYLTTQTLIASGTTPLNVSMHNTSFVDSGVGNGFVLNADTGGITFTQSGEADGVAPGYIMGAESAIVASADGGSVSLVITGAVAATATDGYGINAILTSGTGGMTISAAQSVSGGAAIRALSSATGGARVDVDGSVTATGTTVISHGILVAASGGDMSVAVDGDITAASATGVDATLSAGTGGVDISVRGISASKGIAVVSTASGAVRVSSSVTDTISATSGDGISVVNSQGGNLTVSAGHVFASLRAVKIDHSGSGTVSVDVASVVGLGTQTEDASIVVEKNGNGNTTVNVQDGSRGIYVNKRSGDGGITVTAANSRADATPQSTAEAIYVSSRGNSRGITITATGTTSSRGHAIKVRDYGTGGGIISISAAGTVSGGSAEVADGAGIHAINDAGAIDITAENVSANGESGIGIYAKVANNHLASIRVSGRVTGGTDAGSGAAAIDTRGGSLQGVEITLSSGASVGGAGKFAIKNDGGRSRTTILAGASIVGTTNLGGGIDEVVLQGGRVEGLLDGGAGVDTLRFETDFNGRDVTLSGFDAASISAGASVALAGDFNLGDDSNAAGSLQMRSGSRLDFGDATRSNLGAEVMSSATLGEIRLQGRESEPGTRARRGVLQAGRGAGSAGRHIHDRRRCAERRRQAGHDQGPPRQGHQQPPQFHHRPGDGDRRRRFIGVRGRLAVA